MAKLDNVLVYDWQAWRGFLISHLAENHVTADYDDDFAKLEPHLDGIQALIPQINLTDTAQFPQRRQQLFDKLAERKILIFNNAVTDISKCYLHQLLSNAGIATLKASQDGDPDEFLFIKSNLNYGGEPERRLPDNIRDRFITTSESPITRFNEYYVRKRAAVPPALWQDKTIVIEKFVQNPEHSFYRLYGFGDSLVVVKAHTMAQIKKISGDPKDENFYFERQQILSGKCNLPGNLQSVMAAFLQHIPLCYFCLDIVHDMVNFYIVDLNLTPYSGEQDQTGEAVQFLCHGARSYLKRTLTL